MIRGRETVIAPQSTASKAASAVGIQKATCDLTCGISPCGGFFGSASSIYKSERLGLICPCRNTTWLASHMPLERRGGVFCMFLGSSDLT